MASTVLTTWSPTSKASSGPKIMECFLHFLNILQLFLSVLNIIFLIYIITGDPRREINLMRGFQSKLADFLDYQVTTDGAGRETIFQQLDLILEFTFWPSVMYSFFMIITALARYVFHSKNSNMTLKGKLSFNGFLFLF